MNSRYEDLYLMWLIDQVVGSTDAKQYSLLWKQLYSTEFVCCSNVPLDSNLIVYGEGLRYEFYNDSVAGKRFRDLYGELDMPCNVLELMVYLATAAENDIMQNSYYGNRTSKWFWYMIENLGLECYNNISYDEREIAQILRNFMKRRYSKDGTGGLFRTKNSVKNDMKTAPIWKQLNIFLSEYALEDGEI